MEPPQVEMGLSIDELRDMYWEQAQLAAIWKKHAIKLEALLRGEQPPENSGLKSSLDEIADADLRKMPVDGKR